MRYSKCQAYSERENIDTFKKVKEWKSKGLESRVGDERERECIHIQCYRGIPGSLGKTVDKSRSS